MQNQPKADEVLEGIVLQFGFGTIGHASARRIPDPTSKKRHVNVVPQGYVDITVGIDPDTVEKVRVDSHPKKLQRGDAVKVHYYLKDEQGYTNPTKQASKIEVINPATGRVDYTIDYKL